MGGGWFSLALDAPQTKGDAVSFTTKRRVEFRDTDAAGIVHFSAFFPMMEAAEHELLRSLGLSVMPRALSTGGSDSAESTVDSDLRVTWPRVSASCQYLSAARFEDQLEIEVKVAKVGTTSVQYAFTFLRDEKKLAEGMMTSVCCRLHRFIGVPNADQGGCDGINGATENEVRLEKTPIPSEIRQLLARYQ